MMSDRQKGIPGALGNVLEAVAKVACGRHLYDNVMAQTPHLRLTKADFWSMAKAATAKEFQDVHDRIELPTQAYLDQTLTKDQWVLHAIAARDIKLYGKQTSNGVESENSRLMQARESTPLDFFDEFVEKSLGILNTCKGLARSKLRVMC